MDDARARDLLAARDSAGIAELMPVSRLLRYRGGGISHSWDIAANGDAVPYIAKFPSHVVPPTDLIVAELAIARLAQFFDPPLAASPLVFDVEARHVAGVACGGCGKAMEPSQVFASRQLEDVVEFRGGVLPIELDPVEAARIVGFQTWLEANDPQILISAGGRAYSMDHARYLAGAQSWDGAAPPTVNPLCLAGLDADRRLAARSAFQKFLDQLGLIDDDSIVGAFGAMPSAWHGSLEMRSTMARYAVARKPLVEAAVSAYWGTRA